MFTEHVELNFALLLNNVHQGCKTKLSKRNGLKRKYLGNFSIKIENVFR
jgi:hypothetical protein